ncbi:uncharacterized protein B0T15DRAFT_264647 [Chaetomium strumarium]|uniref:polynucleotide adenylyltransferase n=1 Tax=Chaetomium strumarium TaxID=1170767 RepID=A0AAJ0GND6_9PEZI|nr:hypothetical protein B0T15DRAFT_264647 [Chaetomium strumarium]
MSYHSRYPPRASRSDYQPPPRDYRSERDLRGRHGQQPARDAYRPRSYGNGNHRNDHHSNTWSRETLPPPPPSLPPPPPPPIPYPGPPGGDTYRPPHGDFTFRMNKPAGVQDADNYRPQSGRQRNDRRKPSPRRDSRAGNRNRGPHDGSFGHGNGPRPFPNNRLDRRYGGRPWRPFIAAERELLKTDLNTGAEVAFFDATGGATFRSIDELSDSDEAEMDISGDEGGDVEPAHKRARLTVGQSASDNNTPKWSNPDPYTALPPEAAPQGKKKDVVQMIRKARVQTRETRTSLPSEAADFISFDLDDSEVSDKEKEKEEEPEPATDTTSRVAFGIPHTDLRVRTRAMTSGSELLALDVMKDDEELPEEVDGQSARCERVPVLYPDPTPAALGTRKRTHDDEIVLPHAALKKAIKDHAKGSITKEWVADPKLTATPWMVADHSRSASMAVWLHKEIVDFYEYVRPRDFEEDLRRQLVQDLKKFCRGAFRDAEVYPFGSFPSGLYLPTADMDLAFMSDQYLRGGLPKYHTKSFLYRFRGQLTYRKIAWENEIEIIPGAKVPLVKFIEHKTGLKVDVSFENNTGVTAINTFKAWRERYPGMPTLVTLVKHFLLMRGLNEPVNGGIGGFSVICLVVSMLQMMPEVQSGNLDTRHHLGQLLLHFFDLYGNRFDYQTIAISTNPPQWIPKHQVSGFPYKNHSRFSIIDPNNPANDIAGGSSNTGTIVSQFSRAHEQLTQRMTQLAQDPNRAGQSILEVILGGNYSSFENQRNYLELLAREGYRPGGEGRQSSNQSTGPRGKHVPTPQRPPRGKNSRSRKRR